MNGLQGLDKYTADVNKVCCNRYFQFILMDVNMPFMGGIEASNKIFQLYKEIKKSRNVKFD